MRGQWLPQVGSRDKGDAIIDLRAGAVLARGRQKQVDEGGITGVAGAVGKGHGKAEGIADQNVGATRQVGSRASSQQAVIAGHGRGGQGNGFIDRASADFKGPVTASAGAAGIVVGGANIGAGPA
ncbi:hypothetical protein D3C77_551420 [compost metagenome]